MGGKYKDLEKSKACQLRWRQAHKEELKTRYKAYRTKYHRALKQETLTHYGGGRFACVICGESRFACLSIDHINGGGCQHRKAINRDGGLPFYYWLRNNNYPEGYQTLCMNCQWVKREKEKEYGGMK